jgi:hypothetical protein
MAKIPSYEALTRICQQARRRARKEGDQTVVVAILGDKVGYETLSEGEEIELAEGATTARVIVQVDSDCMELARTLRDRLRKAASLSRVSNPSRAYRNPYASLFATPPSEDGVVTVSDFTTYSRSAPPRPYVRRAHRNPYEPPRRLRR